MFYRTPAALLAIMILFLKNIDIEGPGTLGKFFLQESCQTEALELEQGKPLPERLSALDAIIVLGGPMNVYEEEKYPFLKEETLFLKRALSEDIPILGICLGAQLLAKACGANVGKATEKEMGWHEIFLTEEGVKDPFFFGAQKKWPVFQWHEDTFDIPEGGVRLAGSQACPNQAFRIGRNAYGLQFHIEVDSPIIASWIKEYLKFDDPKEDPKTQEMLDIYSKIKDDFNRQARCCYRNFLNIIKKRVPV